MIAIDVITIFPRMILGPVSDGIVGRAVEAGLARIAAHDLRAFSDDKHRTTDDAPFGGGPGMVMKAEPFLRAVDALGPAEGERRAVVVLSPRGKPFTQATAGRYAGLDRLVLLCGRYEGINERVREGLAAEEVSVGDFILTGGEVAALAVIEATVRLIPGALGDEGSAQEDSFSEGILDHPHYTRPAVVRGLAVPEALLSRRPRAHPEMAPQGGAPGHPRAPPGPRRRRAAGRRRPRPAGDRDRGRLCPREGEVRRTEERK